MKRVGIVNSTRAPYTFEHHMALQLQKGFRENGAIADILVLEEDKLSRQISEIKENPPDFLVTFENIPFLNQFCALSGLPHCMWEASSFSKSLALLKNPKMRIGYPDRFLCTQEKQTFFLPPAGSDHLMEEEPRPYEVIFIDDLVDCEALKNTWKVLFEPATLDSLNHMCSLESHPFEKVKEVFNGSPYPINDLLFLVEEYVRAKRFLPHLEAIQERRIDIFGDPIGNNWLRRLKNKNIFLHAKPVFKASFSSEVKALEMAKILVRDQFLYPDGCDEWVFEAILRGCLVITSRTPYLEEALTPHAPFFECGDVSQMADLVNYYLEFPKKRRELLHFLQMRVKKEHTFESRAKMILKEMT